MESIHPQVLSISVARTKTTRKADDEVHCNLNKQLHAGQEFLYAGKGGILITKL